ncbi:uncharacterized protein LOC127566371 [Drosophila albomicans]|uniref:Uncharacterized protein LOC127566371 n=1 Tax=Drosophila albomicans TaxID=7291 RepID=A0A9C6WM35_DROAB|nr:uncharacterized protein LOC127566371 [Drosophila albomicans]
MEIRKIKEFTQRNPHISLNVFGYDEESDKIIGPLYCDGVEMRIHINLLFVDGPTAGFHGHYVWIKNISSLLAKQLGKHRVKRWFCNQCLQYSTSEERAAQHTLRCSRVVTEGPRKDQKITFKNHHRQLEVPFIVYADFECILEPVTLDNWRCRLSWVSALPRRSLQWYLPKVTLCKSNVEPPSRSSLQWPYDKSLPRDHYIDSITEDQ